MNNYDKLVSKYIRTHGKPDKLFSTLPTVLSIAGDVFGKTILDLGCGAGFFTRAFAHQGAQHVIGIDHSPEQLQFAKRNKTPNSEYVLADIFTSDLPRSDITVASYVLNYARNVQELDDFFCKVYKCLHDNGTFIAVIDLPEGKDLKKFGAMKRIVGEKKDEAPLEIELFKDDVTLCTLNAIYYTQETLQSLLEKAGFHDITWHKPIIAKEGYDRYGKEFWEGYTNAPELGYISAKK